MKLNASDALSRLDVKDEPSTIIIDVSVYQHSSCLTASLKKVLRIRIFKLFTTSNSACFDQ